VGITEDSLAGLFYTGGLPVLKGVMLRPSQSHCQYHELAHCRAKGLRMPIGMAPLFHAAGSLAVLATVVDAVAVR